MSEMSVTERRYKAVLAVIGDGRRVGEVARDWGISRRKMHRWLARYEARVPLYVASGGGLGSGLIDGCTSASYRLEICAKSEAIKGFNYIVSRQKQVGSKSVH